MSCLLGLIHRLRRSIRLSPVCLVVVSSVRSYVVMPARTQPPSSPFHPTKLSMLCSSVFGAQTCHACSDSATVFAVPFDSMRATIFAVPFTVQDTHQVRRSIQFISVCGTGIVVGQSCSIRECLVLQFHRCYQVYRYQILLLRNKSK